MTCGSGPLSTNPSAFDAHPADNRADVPGEECTLRKSQPAFERIFR